MVSFAVQKLFSLIQSKQKIVYFCFYCLGLWCQIQESITKINAKELNICVLFWEFHGFRSYIQAGLTTLWVNFCAWFKRVVHFHSVLHDCPGFQSHLLQRLFLHMYFAFFVYKFIYHTCPSLFLGSMFCSIDLRVCFYSNALLYWFV